jgi:hypothetical protein
MLATGRMTDWPTSIRCHSGSRQESPLHPSLVVHELKRAIRARRFCSTATGEPLPLTRSKQELALDTEFVVQGLRKSLLVSRVCVIAARPQVVQCRSVAHACRDYSSGRSCG